LSAPQDLGPLEIQPDAVATRVLARRHAERRELFRIAGQSALARSRGGRDLEPQACADAKRWAAYEPLPGPMSAGDPLEKT